MATTSVRERLTGRAISTAMVIAFVVAACGGSGTTKPGAVGTAAEQSTTTTRPPSTTPTTIDPLKAAGDVFVKTEADHEAGAAAVETTYTSDVEGSPGIAWEVYPAWCDANVAVDEKWASDVGGVAWPTTIQPQADELVVALGARVDYYHHCAQLGGDFFSQHPVFNEDDTTRKALRTARDNLRSSLGLPHKD